eukprot:2935025-Alexandrium_andersonii.AAC.1
MCGVMGTKCDSTEEKLAKRTAVPGSAQFKAPSASRKNEWSNWTTPFSKKDSPKWASPCGPGCEP